MSKLLPIPGIGDGGQTWQNVLVSRALGTLYTNTTGRAIGLSIAGGLIAGDIISIQLNAQNLCFVTVSATSVGSLFAIIPPNATYKVVAVSALSYWLELR